MDKRFMIILAVVVVLFGAIFWSTKSKTEAPGSNGSSAQASQHLEGKNTSGVTFVEYGDYQCPYCGQYYPIVKQVQAQYADKISYQFRNFPKEERRNKLVTIVSQEEGFGHCWINQNSKLSLGCFDKSGHISYVFPPENKCLFVFVISGRIAIDGIEVPERDGIGIWDTGAIDITCKEESEFLIIETPVNQK